MIILTYCMDNNIKLYKKINNIEIEKYIKLNYDCLNYTTDQISNLHKFEIKTPDQYYNDKRHNDKWHYNFIEKIKYIQQTKNNDEYNRKIINGYKKSLFYSTKNKCYELLKLCEN